MRQVIDDVRYQNEELERQLRQKQDDLAQAEHDLDRYKQIHGKTTNDVEHYLKIIEDLEEKNKKLNEKLNEVVFNKAAAYKQRTMQALRMSQSPERRERQAEHGIPGKSDQRLE